MIASLKPPRIGRSVEARRKLRRRAVSALGGLATAFGAVALLVMSGLPSAAKFPQDAPAYLWRPVAVGGGGFVTGLDADNSGNTRVARTDVYGAYIWSPGLQLWRQLVTSASMPEDRRRQNGMNEGVYEVVVAPRDARRIYLVSKGRVFRSKDKGLTFEDVSNSPVFPLSLNPNSEFRNYGPFMAVSPTDPEVVLLGTPKNGLLRSLNGGATWEQVASVPNPADLRPAADVQAPGVVIWFERAAAGAYSGRVWAMSPGAGVYVAARADADFAPLPSSGPTRPLILKQGAFAPSGTFYGVDAETKSVWTYVDGGWRELTSNPGLRSASFAAVAVNPTDSQIWIFEIGGRVYRSADNGATWSAMQRRSAPGSGDPPWLRVSNQSFFATGRVMFDPRVPNRLWAGTGTGVYYADVASSSTSMAWLSQSRGIEELVTNDVVSPKGRSPLFAAWDFGIHVKPALNTYSNTYGPRERVLIAAQQLDWAASDPGFIVTNASDTNMSCCWQDGDAVMAGYSRDGGVTWTKFPTLPQPPGTSSTDPWRMSFGTIAVSAGGEGNIVWAPTFNRTPFFTTDYGRTWRPVVLEGEVGPSTGSHALYFYARKTLTADRVTPNVFYLVHSGGGANAALKGLWRTSDGGVTWTKAFAGEIAPASMYSAKLRAVPDRAGHLFFTSGVAEAADTWLRRSTDGGVTWSVLKGVDRVDDIGFGVPASEGGYPTIYVSGRVLGQYGIWRSTDDAASWTQLAGFPVGSLDQVTVVAGDSNVFGRVYVGYKGSGWLYGQPARCTTSAYRAYARYECFALNAPVTPPAGAGAK